MAELGERIQRVQPDALKQFAVNAFGKVGVPADDAGIVADHLVVNDLRGVHSHGIMRLPGYVRRIREGGMRARTEVRTLRESPVSTLLDGGNGFGHVVCHRAMTLAIEKADRMGVGIVGARNSSHNGAQAYFAMMALPRDMIGLCMTVGGTSMAPWGGVTPLLGNNPFALAAPAGKEPPFVLDMACSAVARGWMMLAAKRGEKIPLGWALDKRGEPTDDPREGLDGIVLPIGGYKGAGLAMGVSILAGLLTGAPVGSKAGSANDWNLAFARPQEAGQWLAAIRIDLFRPPAEFKAELDWYIRDLRNAQKAKGTARIYFPGEMEHENTQERLQNGVPVQESVLEELDNLAEALGLSRLPRRGAS